MCSFMSLAMSWLPEGLVTVLKRIRLHSSRCPFMSLAIRRLAEALVTMLARIGHHKIVCPFIFVKTVIFYVTIEGSAVS